MGVLATFMKKTLSACLPGRWLRTLRRPTVLPGYYRRFADQIERVIDLQKDPARFGDDYWAAVLRKNAHILDKALHRPDFEPGHSAPYYAQAKRALARISPEHAAKDASIEWAKRKLREYELRQRAPGSRPAVYPMELPRDASKVLWDLLRARRSVRTFAERDVEHDTIRRIAEAANWAPSSCNRQTVAIFATTDKRLIDVCTSTCAGATCFSGPVPCFLSFCADLRPYWLPQEMWLPMVDVGLAVQNCCLYAQTLGLSITLLSWAQSTTRDDAILRRALGIPPHFVIVVNALMGYVEHVTEPPARKSVDATCIIVSQRDESSNAAEKKVHEGTSRKPVRG